MLKEELRSRDLSRSGNKGALVQRLQDAFEDENKGFIDDNEEKQEEENDEAQQMEETNQDSEKEEERPDAELEHMQEHFPEMFKTPPSTPQPYVHKSYCTKACGNMCNPDGQPETYIHMSWCNQQCGKQCSPQTLRKHTARSGPSSTANRNPEATKPAPVSGHAKAGTILARWRSNITETNQRTNQQFTV